MNPAGVKFPAVFFATVSLSIRKERWLRMASHRMNDNAHRRALPHRRTSYLASASALISGFLHARDPRRGPSRSCCGRAILFVAPRITILSASPAMVAATPSPHPTARASTVPLLIGRQDPSRQEGVLA